MSVMMTNTTSLEEQIANFTKQYANSPNIIKEWDVKFSYIAIRVRMIRYSPIIKVKLKEKINEKNQRELLESNLAIPHGLELSTLPY